MLPRLSFQPLSKSDKTGTWFSYIGQSELITAGLCNYTTGYFVSDIYVFTTCNSGSLDWSSPLLHVTNGCSNGHPLASWTAVLNTTYYIFVKASYLPGHFILDVSSNATQHTNVSIIGCWVTASEGSETSSTSSELSSASSNSSNNSNSNSWSSSSQGLSTSNNTISSFEKSSSSQILGSQSSQAQSINSRDSSEAGTSATPWEIIGPVVAGAVLILGAAGVIVLAVALKKTRSKSSSEDIPLELRTPSTSNYQLSKDVLLDNSIKLQNCCLLSSENSSLSVLLCCLINITYDYLAKPK